MVIYPVIARGFPPFRVIFYMTVEQIARISGSIVLPSSSGTPQFGFISYNSYFDLATAVFEHDYTTLKFNCILLLKWCLCVHTSFLCDLVPIPFRKLNVFVYIKMWHWSLKLMWSLPIMISPTEKTSLSKYNTQSTVSRLRTVQTNPFVSMQACSYSNKIWNKP